MRVALLYTPHHWFKFNKRPINRSKKYVPISFVFSSPPGTIGGSAVKVDFFFLYNQIAQEFVIRSDSFEDGQ